MNGKAGGFVTVNDCEEALAAIALEVRTIFNEKVWNREDSKTGIKFTAQEIIGFLKHTEGLNDKMDFL